MKLFHFYYLRAYFMNPCYVVPPPITYSVYSASPVSAEQKKINEAVGEEVLFRIISHAYSDVSCNFNSIKNDVAFAFRGRVTAWKIEKLCDEIFAKIAISLQLSDSDDAEIDLGNYGKFTLKEKEGVLELLNGKNVVILPGCKLSQVRAYFTDVERFIDEFELIEVESNLLVQKEVNEAKEGEEFDVGSESASNSLFLQEESSGSEIDDIEEFDIIADSVKNNSEIPTYLDSNLIDGKLGENGFSQEIDKFISKKFPKIYAVFEDLERRGENYKSFGDFDLYPIISGEDALKKFILAHSKDANLVLVPFVATERNLLVPRMLAYGNIWENHVVLLAVKGGKAVLIDPKRGWYVVKDAVPDNCVKSLEWQGLSDSTNCGFYVYHMITSAITASVQGSFRSVSTNDKWDSNLVAFFKKGKTPDPENIKAGMRALYC